MIKFPHASTLYNICARTIYNIIWENNDQVRITMYYEQIKKRLDYTFKSHESKMNFENPF